jgi:hypothetical protein
MPNLTLRWFGGLLTHESFLGLLVYFIAYGVDAQPASWPPPPTEMQPLAVEELHQNPLEPRLENGSVVDPSDWPASFYAKYPIGQESFSCTATLVGPRSLLTAAHCIADGGSVEIHRQNRYEPYRGHCEWAHPRDPETAYPKQESADWAMCLMGEEVPAYRYETISLRVDTLHQNGRLLLSGFGCHKKRETPDEKQGASKEKEISDGKFRTGPTFIEHLPGEDRNYPNWLATFPAVERGDAFTCPGDSGGAVFQEPPRFERVVVAVNSQRDKAGYGISYLAVLGTGAGAAFLEHWASHHHQRLCGVHDDAPNCRR